MCPPRHFIPGSPGVDSMPLDMLLGPARLLQFPRASFIDRNLLESAELSQVTRLLLGTRNSLLLRQERLSLDYAYVSEDAARFIVERGVRLLGLDYLSLELYQKPGRPAHHILFAAGVVVLDGLDLADIPAGDYELLCLPLKLTGADGAPARAVLREILPTNNSSP